ncbi:hypothetical protein GKR56_11470 [Providencia alcalifaciens]|jgi:hypothetical protein|uniref:hypothetical protein n=1 Tax=Providencia alcalifaciens TaxID=126385 RepID=UPI0012B5B665|nr:hypothetical protein [Providencia alcalifaciens]MTC53851.1 hypothetical protein [Providencia alcalifaciens]
MKSVEDSSYQFILKLRSILEKIPIIKKITIVKKDQNIDYLVKVLVDKKVYILACETKNNGQPRFVHLAIKTLRSYLYGQEEAMTPILLAPYLSNDAQKLCNENNISFMDMEGNAHLLFGGIYINHSTSDKPVSEKRGLRTIFSPKSAQILRLMLNNPLKAWKVTELSEEGKVSLGHVSNVRKNLLEREWAVNSNEGLLLKNPGKIINEWRDCYRSIQGETKLFYTHLHGNGLDLQLRNLLGCHGDQGSIILASFSAAQWLSPYGRAGMHFFYTNESGLEKLISALKLNTTSKGANIAVTVTNDAGVFHDAIEPASGIFTTGITQTYLDLYNQGERGQEAAEHLRNQKMSW